MIECQVNLEQISVFLQTRGFVCGWPKRNLSCRDPKNTSRTRSLCEEALIHFMVPAGCVSVILQKNYKCFVTRNLKWTKRREWKTSCTIDGYLKFSFQFHVHREIKSVNNTERIVSVMCSLLKVVFKGGFLQYSIERMNTGPKMNVRCVDLLKNWEVHGLSDLIWFHLMLYV